VTCYAEGFSDFVTPMTAPVASGWSTAGWGLHPLESAALSRRTREADLSDGHSGRLIWTRKRTFMHLISALRILLTSLTSIRRAKILQTVRKLLALRSLRARAAGGAFLAFSGAVGALSTVWPPAQAP
jgi:hypothetical protein